LKNLYDLCIKLKKMKKLFFIGSLLAVVFLFLSCGSSELQKDTEQIADAMCRNIEVMNKLRSTNPNDSVAVMKLQQEVKKLQIEMTVVYDEFKKKYSDRINDDKFNKEFAQKLRKSMLDCPHLSKEDRANFEKELEE